MIPIKPKRTSKNWDFENALLERTLRSVTKQKYPGFKVIVVYTDKPQVNFNHAAIHYLHHNFPELCVHEIEDFDSYVSSYYEPEYATKMMDKGRKIIYGCHRAKELGCTYLMSVDSDDLVSDRLAGLVELLQERHAAGARINKGYIYEEQKKYVIKNPKIFGVNGSTHIIRKDLVEIPDFSSCKFWDYNLFEAHGYTADRIWQFQNERLEEYDEYGIIYVLHGQNYSAIKSDFKHRTLRYQIKRILRGKFITKSLRSEFGLYPLPQQL